MNKKLITLAVAAALVAPAAAMAEAVLYGKVNVSLDYADVKNVVLPTWGFARDANGDVILNAAGAIGAIAVNQLIGRDAFIVAGLLAVPAAMGAPSEAPPR